MDDLNATISSILGDPNKMQQLRAVAESLGINTGGDSPPSAQPPANNPPAQSNFDPNAIASILQNFQNLSGGGAPSGTAPPQAASNAASTGSEGPMFNLDMISKLSGIMSTFNQSDKNVDLLRSLKPHFSPSRAGKIDDAVRIMQVIRAWPSIKDSGLLSSLGGLGKLFTGGGGR